MNEPVAAAAPVESLSTVCSVTGTVPTAPGGAVTVTVSVDPQSSSAAAFEASTAATLPKEIVGHAAEVLAGDRDLRPARSPARSPG